MKPICPLCHCDMDSSLNFRKDIVFTCTKCKYTALSSFVSGYWSAVLEYAPEVWNGLFEVEENTEPVMEKTG